VISNTLPNRNIYIVKAPILDFCELGAAWFAGTVSRETGLPLWFSVHMGGIRSALLSFLGEEMKKQLQYTTTFVVILLMILMGTLYMIETSPAFDGVGNDLTGATTVMDSIDCNTSLEEVATDERLAWEEECLV
jgi:purine-cytosine permease-like protein